MPDSVAGIDDQMSNGGIGKSVKQSVESYGLPLGLVLLGYGSLVMGGAEPVTVGVLRLVLHTVAVLLIGRLGMRMGLNRTSALLAGLFYAASPLAAFSLVADAPLLMQIWTCVALGIMLYSWKSWQPRRLGLIGLAAAFILGTLGAMVLGGVFEGATHTLLAIPRDLIAFGGWFVLPAPMLSDMGHHLHLTLVLGGGVWTFWILMSFHRREMDDPWPQNLLILTLTAVVPVLAAGSRVGPGMLLLPMAMFLLFLMSFLRPSKLTDSPRILLMAAFFLTLLASSTALIIAP